MSLKFPISLVGKRASSGGDGPFATSLYDSGDNLLVSIETDIPDNWNDNSTPYFATRLEIGTSCTSIGSNAFQNCVSLTSSLVIPDSVTTIGSNAFYNCTSLTGDLVIPDSVTTIGDQVFYNGSGFTGNLVIPYSVTSIGSYAFYFCNNLSAVYTNTPASSFTGSGAFYGTTFSTIYIGPSAIGYTSSFQGRTGLTIAPWTNYPNIP